MTDLQGSGRPGGCVSAANNALYYGWQGAIHELDLETLEERELWRQTPPMLIRGQANPTADGKYVCVMLGEARRQEGPARLSFSYSNFRDLTYCHEGPWNWIDAHETWDADVGAELQPHAS
jgi:hypothetical protein